MKMLLSMVFGGVAAASLVQYFVVTEIFDMMTLFFIVPVLPFGYLSNYILGGNCFNFDFAGNELRTCPMGTAEYDQVLMMLTIIPWFIIGALLGLLVYKGFASRRF